MDNYTDISVYKAMQYAKNYEKYRWMPLSAFNAYYDNVNKKSRMKILDVGCGIGQFSLRLADALRREGYSFIIDAVDVSENELSLLRAAAKKADITNVNCINANFMELDINKEYDLIICSEIIHLIPDLLLFCRKMCKLLSREGNIFIRTASPKQLLSRKSYDFFPKCRYIDLLRNKSPELLETTFALCGKRIIKIEQINESQYLSKKTVFDLFNAKAFSTLFSLSENEINEGINKMREFYKMQSKIFWDFYMTLYIVG